MSDVFHNLSAIDPLSLSVAPLTLLNNETEVSNATGFFYSGLINDAPCMWLVSNWHVFSGRHTHPPHAPLHRGGAIPNRVRLQVLKARQNNVVEVHHLFANLYESDGTAFWYQHKSGSDVDVAVLNVAQGLAEFSVRGINVVASRYDMKIEIGDNVFILGYPLGFSHFITTPIWKRGTIASEPYAETELSKNRIIIDATTRTGMSGSPVVLREKTQYFSESGAIIPYHNASRLLGVYSSRPTFMSPQSSVDGIEDRRSELAYVYKSGLIDHVIRDGVRGMRYGELP